MGFTKLYTITVCFKLLYFLLHIQAPPALILPNNWANKPILLLFLQATLNAASHQQKQKQQLKQEQQKQQQQGHSKSTSRGRNGLIIRRITTMTIKTMIKMMLMMIKIMMIIMIIIMLMLRIKTNIRLEGAQGEMDGLEVGLDWKVCIRFGLGNYS